MAGEEAFPVVLLTSIWGHVPACATNCPRERTERMSRADLAGRDDNTKDASASCPVEHFFHVPEGRR